MAEIALIKSGVVSNVIEATLAFAQTLPFDAAVDVTNTSPRPAPGWTWDGTKFTAPPAPPQPSPADTPATTAIKQWLAAHSTATDAVSQGITAIMNKLLEPPHA